jgi:hypothetical protein
MTDNNMQESEIRTSEQVANPEPEHQTPVTILYRGENPFMRTVATSLKQKGLNVIDRSVADEKYKELIEDATYKVVYSEQAKLEPDFQLLGEKVRESIGDLPTDGLVVTDFTLHEFLYNFGLSRDPIEAYKYLGEAARTIEGVKEDLEPIVEALRRVGKTPVISVAKLSDHMSSFRLSKVEQQILERKFDDVNKNEWNKAHHYALAASLTLGVPVILGHEFNFEWSNGRNLILGNVVEALVKKGLDPKQVVLLVDHHLDNLRSSEVKTAGLDQVELALICRCCIDFGEKSSEYKQNINIMESAGIKFHQFTERYSTELQSTRMDRAVNNLYAEIQKRQAEKQTEEGNS